MPAVDIPTGRTPEASIAKMKETLDWLLENLNHFNVKQLYTEYCQIQSENGETHIDGPLLVMKDDSGVTRLTMGYDAGTDKFLFTLHNEAGVATISIDSNGNAVFSGSLNAATGTFAGQLTAQDVIINNGAGTGSLNFNINNQYLTLKTSYTTGGNTLIVGKTTGTGQTPSLMERIDMMAGWLYVYNHLYVASSISIGGAAVATQAYVNAAMAAHIAAYHSGGD